MPSVPPTAGECESPSFAAAARAASDEGRAALLAQADGLASGDVEARRRALAVYRALLADLDPRSADGRGRLRFVLGQDRRFDAGNLEAAERAARATDDPDLADQGAVRAAQGLANAGRVPEAQARLEALLARSRGTGRPGEFQALQSLARIHHMLGDEAEAFLLARRAVAWAQARGDAAARSLALERLWDALRRLEDPEGVADLEERLLAALSDAPPARAWETRRQVHGVRVVRAVDAGDAPRAREELARMAACVPSDAPIPGDPRRTAFLEAQVDLLEGRVERARTRLARLPGSGGAFPGAEVELALLSGRAALAAGDPAEARAHANRALRAVLHDEDARLGAGDRFRRASEAAALLRGAGAPEDEVAAAHAAAASAAVERVWNADRAARALPEVLAAPADDLRALGAFRARFLEAHAEACRRATAHLLAREDVRGARAWPLAYEDRLLPVCGWCRRVLTRDGRWLPIGHFLVDAPGVRATHGMCPTCREQAMQESAAIEPPAPRAPSPSAPSPPGREAAPPPPEAAPSDGDQTRSRPERA